MQFLEIIIGAYILGSIPFSYLVGKACGVNILDSGSKNSGPTNLYRNAGFSVASVAFFLEALKGVIPVLLARDMGYELWQMLIVGIVAVVGHTLSPFLKFKGGKGASTLLGVIIAFDWHTAVIVFALWAIILLIAKTVSIATILASMYFGSHEIAFQADYRVRILCGLIAAYVVFKHRSNICRIIDGAEPKTIQPKPKILQKSFPDGVRKGEFLIHQTKDNPADTKEKMGKKYPIFKCLPAGFLHNVVFPNIPVEKMNMGYIVIKAKDGTESGLEFRGLPYTPRLMIQREQKALNMIRKLMDISIVADAKIVGFGAYTSIIGNGGRTIADEYLGQIATTTGSSLTVGMAIRGTESLAKEVGLDITECGLTVIGATGAIGSVVAEIMAPNVKKIYIVGRDIKDERLVALAKKIRLLGGMPIIAPLQIALANSELVITATSKTEALNINPNWFRENAIVCDVARPRDVAREVAKAREDIIVLDGGIVLVPELIEQTFDFGYPPGYIYACMAETLILLIKNNTATSYSLVVTKESVSQMLRWGDQLGFKLSGYRSLDIPISAERIAAHRKAVLAMKD
ncbi:MAG: glycerol-3-phosphate 1-O-acyltransferase PlsY [Candidatus Berkelbacteria bacterium]